MSCAALAVKTAECIARAAGTPVATGAPQEDVAAYSADMESRLAAFRAKYGVTFTRETFTRNRPNARGEFELTPNDNGNRAGRDPLPPLGCHIKVYDYNGGEAWQTVVTAVDKQRGTYVATIIQDGGAR